MKYHDVLFTPETAVFLDFISDLIYEQILEDPEPIQKSYP